MVVGELAIEAWNSCWCATAEQRCSSDWRGVRFHCIAKLADKNVCPTFMIRIVIPYHLKMLAQISGEVELEVPGLVTIGSVLDALEARYPMLRGTIRDHGTLQRRPFIRFYLCQQDWSLEPTDKPLPEAIAAGTEPFLVIGAIAGG